MKGTGRFIGLLNGTFQPPRTLK